MPYMPDPSRLFEPSQSYIRIASARPRVKLADSKKNSERIASLYLRAAEGEASLVVFPELSIPGYTIGDLVRSSSLLDHCEEELCALAAKTAGVNCAMVVGLPLRFRDSLYNTAAFLADGQIKGIVPKTNLPTYNEFYENRWFRAWEGPPLEASIGPYNFPIGQYILFGIKDVWAGIEICEDLWVAQPPSGRLASMGAKIIANPSASPEQIGKESYRRDLVRIQSGRLICAYVYSGCDSSESTSEIVMGGHHIIADNYALASEIPPFGEEEICYADIDFAHLEYDRRLIHFAPSDGAVRVMTSVYPKQRELNAVVGQNPFAPDESAASRIERLDKAIHIQATGLAERMRSTGQNRAVIGVSGGLDSALALLVSCEAAKMLGMDIKNSVLAVTMPGLASSNQTQSNSVKLANALGCESMTVPILEISMKELSAIGHDGTTQDVTYENVQARARTAVLFNLANLRGGIVVGTGDLSEIAMGWNTYNGDQQSHYNVNGSIPKTLVRLLVKRFSERPGYTQAKGVLEDILATPISPELTKSKEGEITQSTEEIIGPYDIHDFFLYYTIRYGDSAEKISYLAQMAFKGRYSEEQIENWLKLFTRRFNQSQFKRDNMPNGPKVGAVSLSPRGDWRMPSDMP